MSDSTNSYGQGGLWRFVLNSSSGLWMSGAAASPYYPPVNNGGISEISSRIESSVLMVYAALASTPGVPFSFVFNTATRAWTALPALSTARVFISDTTYKSASVSPCDPWTNGPCDGSAAGGCAGR